MESRQDESRKEPQPRQEEPKRRFQIVKLEERIAPCNPHWNSHDKYVGFRGCKGYGY